jgi:polygalacturonase
MKNILIVCMLLVSAFVTVGSVAIAELVPEPEVFDIREYGAVGDFAALDTKAVQNAIDACTASGGGIVWVPVGRYRIGTIHMKSNVTLTLDSGAFLFGSQDLADYPTEGLIDPAEGGPRCLIYAEDATNIAFQGLGVIDGQGTPEAFPRNDGPRPRLMRLMDCEGITFSGLTYKRPAFWGLHLINCKDIHFTGVTIQFRNNQYNNDGIDLDGCSDVLIENCRIDAGDDSICLKSTGTHPCSNIVVRGCDVSSTTAAVKFGTSSSGGFVDVRVTDCRFYDCPMGAIKLQIVDGGRMDNVEFSRIIMERVGGPFFIRLGNRGRIYQSNTRQKFDPGQKPEGAPVGSLRNVRFKDIVAEVNDTEHDRMGSMISGIPGHRIENVTFENIDITFTGGGPAEAVGREVPEDIARYPEQFFFGLMPSWGFYLRHVDGIGFKNVNIQTRRDDPRPAVVMDDVLNYDPSGLYINGVKAK